MKIKKLAKVEVAHLNDQDYIEAGIVAFQLVEFEIDFFGTVQKFTLDTKILKTGEQIVIDGNGWIASGQDISALEL